MKSCSKLKSISHSEGHAVQIASHLAAGRETVALLRILALGDCQIEAGKLIPAKEALRKLRARLRGK